MKIIFKVCWMMDMNIFKRRKRIMKKIIKQAESILECKQDVLLHLLKDWLKKVNTPNFWKILINCGSNIEKKENKVVGGVYEVDYELNIEEFMYLSDIEKKR